MYLLEDRGLGDVYLSERKLKPCKFVKLRSEELEASEDHMKTVSDLGLHVDKILSVLLRGEDIELISAEEMGLIKFN